MVNVNIDDEIYKQLKEVYPYAQVKALVNYILKLQIQHELEMREEKRRRQQVINNDSSNNK